MRVIKCGLNAVARCEMSKAFFQDTVRRVHDAKIAAHLLCKEWILERFENGEPLPSGQGALVSLFENAVWAITGSTSNTQRAGLRTLCDTIFPAGFVVNMGPMKNWPTQAATRYGAQVVEHLSRCYGKCMEKYLASTLGLEGKEHRRELMAIVRAVMRKEPTPHVPLNEARRLVPGRALEKNYAMYDVRIKKTVVDYLPCMLHMAAHLERAGQRGFAVLPLVGSLVPEAVFLDTDTLLALLPDDLLEPGRTQESYRREWHTPNPSKKRGKPSQDDFDDDAWMRKQEKLHYGQARLWNLVLDLSKLPVRGPSWCFDNRIQTDGVSISVYAQHERDYRAKGQPKYAEYHDENYVQHLEDLAPYRGRTIVSIDPGKQNIIFAVDASTAGPNLKPTTLRYTARQRRAETRQANAEAHAAAFRGTTPLVQGRSIDQWEAWLSEQPSRRTLDSVAFRAHIAAFYLYVEATRDFWHDPFHRKQRLDAYRQKQRSESRLVKTFKAKFGPPRDVVIAFGDGARNNLSGRAPGPSTAIRRLFQRHHYPVIDVHEPYTSKRCFACKRPDADNGPCRLDVATGQAAWGVRRCCRCGTSWARDFNACLNIDRIAREHLAGLDRPDYLTVASVVFGG